MFVSGAVIEPSTCPRNTSSGGSFASSSSAAAPRAPRRHVLCPLSSLTPPSRIEAALRRARRRRWPPFCDPPRLGFCLSAASGLRRRALCGYGFCLFRHLLDDPARPGGIHV